MSERVTERFIQALHAVERECDVDALSEMFTEDAEISNVVSPRSFRGREGARDFWTTYRATFGEMESSFRNVIVSEGAAALEWTTTGTSVDGKPVEYDGVSVLEIEGDRVKRFRAFFNPSALGHQMEGHA